MSNLSDRLLDLAGEAVGRMVGEAVGKVAEAAVESLGETLPAEAV